jgi:transposase
MIQPKTPRPVCYDSTSFINFIKEDNIMTDLNPIVKSSAGLDVHKKIVVATILVEQQDGSVMEETREFGTFPHQRKKLALWLKSNNIELIAMESTGVYWKSVYTALEEQNLKAYVVNARHVKNVPGRKTDVKDSQWLATLARFGLVKNSFIPPKELRNLRLVSRYRTKLTNTLAGEKNRLHKLLDDAGIYLGNIVSDINGVSARAIIKGLIEGKSIRELLKCIRGTLKKKTREFKEALESQLSKDHLLTLSIIHEHIEYLEATLQKLNNRILGAMEASYKKYWEILQTIPGMDAVGAAIFIIEVGVDMTQFGSMKQFCSWAGICPGNNESAGKRYSGRTRKGNRQLRQILCEISNGASKTDSQFKSKYKGLVIRRGHKRSIIAIGHKIMRISYTLLKNEQAYKDPKIDYEELVVRKNAPRWIKMLEKFRYISLVQEG